MPKKKEKHWYIADEDTTSEASVVSGIKGFQMPIGAKGKKKKVNPSSPFGDEKLKEELEKEIEETIEKRGDKWAVVDPTTGAVRATAQSREQARQAQDNLGLGVRRKQPGQSALPQRNVDIHGKAKTKPKKRKTSKPSMSRPHFEHLKVAMKNKLRAHGLKASQIKESSMISYMFESPVKESIWESFLGKIPRKAAMSDMGLAEAIKFMAQTEARTLARSVMEIKKVLESAGSFLVERKQADQDPETGDIRMPFTVAVSEGMDPLLFAVKLEGGKPCVLFPESSRNVLNNMLTKESKLLRAELMHVQETVLDKIEDVLEAAQKRDMYLDSVQSRLSEMVEGLNLVETAIMKNLVRNKLKGVK